jgi:Cu(I)/Ag(I) efflux system membrane fusion protein/cobalt-zinc-cadmium efflux system membrane fusion protein
MYVNVNIAAPLGRQLVIPASGALQAGTRQIAFIDRGQGSLEPREIETGLRFNDSVVVLKGLKAGDRIVSSANFLVDSEAQLQSAMSGYTASSQQNVNTSEQATEQLHIDFATQPSPPRKGANTILVKLSRTDGKPVTGVQAIATFFMPAMPAMGMAAQHASAALADRGNGNYEASVQLDVGGTWQVTIAVQRGGKTIATKTISMNATGGM